MNAATQSKKYFTVEEANQSLPLVKVIVSDIVQLYADIHDRKQRLMRVRHTPGTVQRDEETVYSEELEQIEQELEKDVQRLDGYVKEIQELGIELKNFETGLIDFYSMMNGKEVYLCWKLGEPEVGFWHDLEAGFSGRQQLLEETTTGNDPVSDQQSE
jgi:hypothetical protein